MQVLSIICKIQFIISFILLLQNFCIGQTTITGIVVDTNNIPIEFANVYVKGKPVGTNTDEQGIFILKVNNINEIQLGTDSIIISHIEFKSKILALNNIKDNEKITLEAADPIAFNPVLVSGSTQKEFGYLGTSQIKTNEFLRNNLYKSYQVATLITNHLHKEGYISEIQIYIGSLGNQKNPFRIQLFELDSICKCPGKPLLNKDILIKKAHKGWNKININNYYLDIPISDFFIGYQWLYSDKKESNKSIFESSHSLGLTKEAELVMSYEKIGDSKWLKLDFLNLKQFRPMFRVKVIYYTDGK